MVNPCVKVSYVRNVVPMRACVHALPRMECLCALCAMHLVMHQVEATQQPHKGGCACCTPEPAHGQNGRGSSCVVVMAVVSWHRNMPGGVYTASE